jgi:hypothetical protein
MKTRTIILLMGTLLIASSVNAREQMNLSGSAWKLLLNYLESANPQK